VNERRTKPGQRGTLADRLEKLDAYGARCQADKLCAYATRFRLTYVNEDKPEQGETTIEVCSRHRKFYERPPLKVTRKEVLDPLPQTGKQWQKP
jgi:hypothetical protein